MELLFSFYVNIKKYSTFATNFFKLMLPFKPVTIDDKNTLQSFFNKVAYGNCDFSFSNIFSWKNSYNTTFAIKNDFLYIRFKPFNELSGYLFPAGDGDIIKAIENIKQDARERETADREHCGGVGRLSLGNGQSLCRGWLSCAA